MAPEVYTSIITIQEVSVLSFRAGTLVEDNHAKINKLARIQTITREIALTAAKLEAIIINKASPKDRIENNRRRKWDCFHIATAIQLSCKTVYSLDEGMLARREHLSLQTIQFLPPLPGKLDLFQDQDVPRIQ